MTTIPELKAMLQQMTLLDQLSFQGWVLWRMQTDAPEHYGIADQPIGLAWKGLSAADQERVAAAFAAYEAKRKEGWRHDGGAPNRDLGMACRPDRVQ
jgi:hypothetical protein